MKSELLQDVGASSVTVNSAVLASLNHCPMVVAIGASRISDGRGTLVRGRNSCPEGVAFGSGRCQFLISAPSEGHQLHRGTSILAFSGLVGDVSKGTGEDTWGSGTRNGGGGVIGEVPVPLLPLSSSTLLTSSARKNSKSRTGISPGRALRSKYPLQSL